MERLIRFVRESFFGARRFRDLDDLNAQVDQWCRTRAAERPCPEDPRRTVAEVFAEERAHLLELPDDPFPCEERVEVQVAKTPTCDSTPTTTPSLTALSNAPSSSRPPSRRCASSTRAPCSPPIGARSTADSRSKTARTSRRSNATSVTPVSTAPPTACTTPPPSAKALFAAAAKRHHHLGVLARGLIELLNAHGPAALERAIAAALQADAPHLAGVRHLIDQHRQQTEKPPPLPLDLPDDSRLRSLHVRPHDLADYDRLHDQSDSAGNDEHRDDGHEQNT